MIVIDSSAIIAILNDEPERKVFNEATEQADGCLISTASFVEASIVIDNQRGYDGFAGFRPLHYERRNRACSR
jgi:ribonuclease VapC